MRVEGGTSTPTPAPTPTPTPTYTYTPTYTPTPEGWALEGVGNSNGSIITGGDGNGSPGC